MKPEQYVRIAAVVLVLQLPILFFLFSEDYLPSVPSSDCNTIGGFLVCEGSQGRIYESPGVLFTAFLVLSTLALMAYVGWLSYKSSVRGDNRGE